MTTTLILRSGWIGMATAVAIGLIILLWKKELLARFPKPLIKSGLTGFILGCAGCVVSYQAMISLSDLIQSPILLLILILLISFVFGMIFNFLLEKTFWSRIRCLNQPMVKLSIDKKRKSKIKEKL